MALEAEKKSIVSKIEPSSELGYIVQVKIDLNEPERTYSLFSAYAFTVSISGLFSTIGTSFIYPLLAGAGASIVWSWFIAGFGCLFITLSVAEFVSAYPSSGGLYHVCYHVYPKDIAPYACWITGWMSFLAQLAITSSSEYGAAQMLLTAVSIGSDSKYVPTAAQTVGVTIALLVLHGTITCMPVRYVEKAAGFYTAVHGVSLLAGAVALLCKTNPRHDASYVFGHLDDNSGWKPEGWSFIFGFLSVSWSMTFYDGTAHLADSLKRPERTAPWAISLGMGTTFILGFLYNIVLAFCMKQPEDIMTETLPVAAIYYNSMGKTGGVAFTVLMFVVMNFVVISVLQSTSWTIWAQAKDNMFPGAKWCFGKLFNKTGTPIYSVILATFLCICINLIGIGSSTTVSAIFNVTAICFDWVALIPIVGKLLYPSLFQRGPWHLGPMSTLVNYISLAWIAFVTVVFCMPYTKPVTAENMNYAVVFFVFTFAASSVWWVCGAKKIYKGPINVISAF